MKAPIDIAAFRAGASSSLRVRRARCRCRLVSQRVTAVPMWRKPTTSAVTPRTASSHERSSTPRGAATPCGQSPRSGSGLRWRRRALNRRACADRVGHGSAARRCGHRDQRGHVLVPTASSVTWGHRSRRRRSRVIGNRGRCRHDGERDLAQLPDKRYFASCAPAPSASADAVWRIVRLEAATPPIVNSGAAVSFAIRKAMNGAARTATVSGALPADGVRPRQWRCPRPVSPMSRWRRRARPGQSTETSTSSTRSARSSVTDQFLRAGRADSANPSLPITSARCRGGQVGPEGE